MRKFAEKDATISNCEKHKKEIIQRWKEGETVVSLEKEFKCHHTYIKRLLVKVLGEKRYRKGCRERTGRGASLYNTYPKWMIEKGKEKTP